MKRALAITPIIAGLTIGGGLMVGVDAQAAATKGPPYLLEEGWVCVTPEDYDRALEEEAKTSSYPERKALRDRLLDENLCLYIEDDDVEDIMAPFVEVLEEQGDMIKVTFTIEFYKRHAMLHRTFRRVTFSGWTAQDQLADYRPLGGL